MKKKCLLLVFATFVLSVFNAFANENTTSSVTTQEEAPCYMTYSNRGHGHIYCNDLEISANKYMAMCADVNVAIWNQYRKGTNLRKAGTILLSVGGGVTAAGLFFTILGTVSDTYNTDASMRVVGLGLMAPGLTAMVVGIPLYCVGKSLRKRSVNNYNLQSGSYKNHDVSLNLGISSNGGVGLMLNF